MLRNVVLWILRTLMATVICTVAVVAVFRFIPPAVTPLMVQRMVGAPFTGRRFTVKHHWVSLSQIKADMGRAVVASEDAKFLKHNGIDWNAVKTARRANISRERRGKPPLGASTITMQTCKNVFLLPWRSMIRKGAEVYFVYLTEALWGKERILEVYLNMIEWGDGIYGIHQGAEHWFSVDAENLTTTQASLLAAILPNPRRFSASKPSPYIRRKASWVRGRMRGVSLPK